MIQVERIVSATPGRVWEYLGDLERWAELLPTIDEITHLDVGPTMMGSRFRVRQPGLMAAEYVVTDWRPGAGFTWQVRSIGVTLTASHTLNGRGGSTELRLSLEWTGRMASLHRALFTRKAQAFITREADTFASLAESGHGRPA